MKPLVFVTVEEHFKEVVQEAVNQKKVSTHPQVESYLVYLLKHYVDSRNFHAPLKDDGVEKPPDTFAEMYLQAINAETPKNKELMRIVGERSLYLTGFFSDSLQKKIVDVDYYLDIGSAAYLNLSYWTKEDTMAFVYQTISKQFLELVSIFNYISEKSLIQSDQNILRVYDRYLRTGSELAREKLNELGVVTLTKEQLKQNKA